jgi:hypothetical protein
LRDSLYRAFVGHSMPSEKFCGLLKNFEGHASPYFFQKALSSLFHAGNR